LETVTHKRKAGITVARNSCCVVYDGGGNREGELFKLNDGGNRLIGFENDGTSPTLSSHSPPEGYGYCGARAEIDGVRSA
jgi:hypothetical protein